MTEHIPKFDIPTSFMAGDNITWSILELYAMFPCKIKAGVFVLCLEGEVSASINLSDYKIKKGDLVTLEPGSFIQIHKCSEDIVLYYAIFSSAFMEGITMLPIIAENPVAQLSMEQLSVYADFYKWLIKARASSTGGLSQESLRSVLNILLQETTEIYRNGRQKHHFHKGRETEIYNDFLKLLFENYMSQHRVSFYASKLGITFQHFCNTIKKATGRKALEIINSIIVMDAKAQLKATDLPVKHIAAALGFSNPAFFNKYFKQHTGMTPQEYRKS